MKEDLEKAVLKADKRSKKARAILLAKASELKMAALDIGDHSDSELDLIHGNLEGVHLDSASSSDSESSDTTTDSDTSDGSDTSDSSESEAKH